MVKRIRGAEEGSSEVISDQAAAGDGRLVTNIVVAQDSGLTPVAVAAEVRDGIDAGRVAASAMIAPHTPPRSNATSAVVSPGGTNRERFQSSAMPSQISCDLSSVSTEPGFRFSFQAIVLVVFPASTNPIRRHVLVGDGRGTVGITVWNAHVNSFSFQSIGQCVHLTKVSVTVHNGIRALSMNKESTVSFSSGQGHFCERWWTNIPTLPAISAVLFQDTDVNSVVNLTGILGSVAVEQRHVRNDARDLLTLKLVDRTGVIIVRSWNHGAGMFQRLVDTPIMLSRVRVTSFGGQKTGELFDGSGTTLSEGTFPGSADLVLFWSE
jgi:hypothetical protein